MCGPCCTLPKQTMPPSGPDLAVGVRDGRSEAPDRPKPRPQPQNPQRAAEPVYGRRFDPWNAVSLGHQRAETTGPLGWRESRAAKLGSQFRAGHGGGERISDTVGAGSKDYDKRLRMVVPSEVRARAATSVLDMLRGPAAKGKQPGGVVAPAKASASAASRPTTTTTTKATTAAEAAAACTERTAPQRSSTGASNSFGYGVQSAPPSPSRTRAATAEETLAAQRKAEDEAREDRRNRPKGIFDGLVIYVNGSMHPHISDHRLKHVLAENGARMTIHLGRRQVTHVILGRPASASSASVGGAGGGLAGGKLEREISRTRGCGIKYVDVHW